MKRKMCDCDPPFYSKLRHLNSGLRVFSHSVESLVNLSAKVVAEYIPFEYVEKRLVNVPELVQERIIFHSFPRRDGDIYTYASFHSKSEKSRDKLPFYQGQELFHNQCVDGVVQIGFHLTGSVKNLNNINVSNNDSSKFEVSITFDRCKIISACCDCGNKGLSWCPHIVALALYRIRKPHFVQYRSPISDALFRMDRGQLQKFAQYLIASHPNKVLPSAQHLADQLLLPESVINTTCGAPDPTAGAGIEEVAAWYLDEAGVREQLRTEFASLANNNGVSLNTHTSFSSFPVQSAGIASTRHVLPSARSGQTVSMNVRSTPARSDISSGDTRVRTFEIGLDWLIRYRRVCQNYNPLSVHPATLTQHQHQLTCPIMYPSSCFCHYSSLYLGSNNNAPFAIDRQQNTQSLLCRFGAHDRGLCNNNGIRALPSIANTCSDSGGCYSGGRITAMFAKVRELLVKKDSNGPRLLCIITEELLRWPHLSTGKSRRNHRSTSFDPLRSSSNISNRLLTLNPATEYFRHGSSFSSDTLHQRTNCWPSWTTRLWEEICLLWTCVVLSPDCSTEMKKHWRERFLVWSRQPRCPRDEGFFVPPSYFKFLQNHPESAGLFEDEMFSTSRSTHQQHSHTQRVPVFYLPIQVSFMTWSTVWLQRLGSTAIKESKDPVDSVSGSSPTGENRVNSNVCSDMPFEPFNVISSSPSRLSTSNRFADRRDCCCPYCDYTLLLSEPFPLLCLRVTALRTNGYLDEAIRLSVLISQQVLRVFHTKVASFTPNYNLHVNMGNDSHYDPNQRTPSKLNSLCNRACNSVPLFPMNITTTESSTGRRSVLLSPGARHLGSINHPPHSPYPSVNPRSTYHASVHSPPIPGGTFHPAGRLTSPLSPLSPPISMGPVHRLPPPSHSRLHADTPPPPLYRTLFPNQRVASHPYNQAGNCTPVLSFGHHIPPSSGLPNSSGGNNTGLPPLAGHMCYQRHQHHLSPPVPVFARSHTVRHSTNQPLLPTSSANGQRLPSSLHPHYLSHYPHHPHNHYNHQQQHRYYQPHSSSDQVSSCCELLSVQAVSVDHDDLGCLISASSMTSFSHQFSCHSSDYGWVGMVGRPVVGLVECLMEAAVAVVVENHTAQGCLSQHRQRSGTSLEAQPAAPADTALAIRSPSFYIGLAIRISLLSMFQQRRISTSLTRLSSGLCQEARLLSLLSTVPKDETALRAVCETVCQLLGPPPSAAAVPTERSGRIGAGSMRSYSVEPLRSPSSSSTLQTEPVNNPHWFWWWSQLGPVVHGDSHPVHAAANFVLTYLQETQQYRLNQIGASVSSTAGWAPLRTDHLLIAVLTRTIRFSTVDQLLDGAGSQPIPNHRAGGTNQSHSSDGNASLHQRGWQSSTENAFTNTPSNGNAHHPASSSPTNTSTGLVNTSENGFPPSTRWDYPFRLESDLSLHRSPPPLPSSMVAWVLSCLSPPEAFSDYYRSYTQTSASACKEAESRCLCSSEQPSRSVRSAGDSCCTSGHPPRHPLEMLESRQTQLVVALINYTRLHVHRLDHVVQLCCRYIRSASSLMTISQQVFADLIVATNADELHHLNSSSSVDRHHFSPVKLTPAGHFTFGRENCASDFRLHILCTAFYLAMLAVVRTNSRSLHRRRREMLVWMLTMALHVGPPACVHTLTHWQRYATPWEAVNLVAPTLLAVQTGHDCSQSRGQQRTSKPVTFGPVNVATLNGLQQTPLSGPQASEARSQRFPATATIYPTTNPVMRTADELLVNQVLPTYSAAARDQISSFVKHMAMQAASRDPVSCAIPALTLAGGSTSNFDVVYRTVVASAEAGALGSTQLFTLARYMESRGWIQRAIPFAVHAVRLFTLASMQDNYSGAGDVLWACSLAHRLGPWALQQVLGHVVRNIHCPILLTDILYRCRISPPGTYGTTGGGENQPPNCNYTGYNSQAHAKQTLLSLDRMPLKSLLDAAIWAYFTETHARLANISPRQYSEFIEFLTRARDTFYLLRPHGPNQFYAMIEGLRQIYRGKRKLVALLSERFG